MGTRVWFQRSSLQVLLPCSGRSPQRSPLYPIRGPSIGSMATWMERLIPLHASQTRFSMSGVRSLYRGPGPKGYASANSAPIRVDDTSNKVRAILTGSGTTEVDVLGQYAPVSLTANTTLTAALHGNKVLVVNKVDGLTATLPAASGSGVKFKFVIGTLMTSNSFIVQVASASDYFRGIQFLKDDAAGGAQ